MKFSVEKEVLVRILGNVQGSIGKKGATIPILLNVKIEVQNNKLSLTATDLDIVITSMSNVRVEKEGKTTVPAQLFYDIIRKVPDGSEILIEMENANLLAIKYGRSKFKLPCLSVDEFPSIEQNGVKSTFLLPAVVMRDMIDKVRFAISNDETRYFLNGIYFHSKEVNGVRKIRSVSTDGHRLAMVEYDAEESFSAIQEGVIIPKKAIQEMHKVMDVMEGEVKLSISNTKIKIDVEDTTIVSKLIDGTFPDYERVIPKDNDKFVKVDKKLFSDAIDRVSTISDDKHRSIRMDIENNKINVRATATEGSCANEEISCVYSEEKIETGFNSRYLLDVLTHVDEVEVVLTFKDGNYPAIIKGDGNDKVLFVVMPVRA